MLLQETDLDRLPNLYDQEKENDPIVYAKIATPDNKWTCYIAEAGKKENDTYVFALFVRSRHRYNWAQVPLHEIEDDLRNAGLEARVDRTFTPDRVSVLTGIRRRETLDDLRRTR
jgi:hypothetical protein